MPSCGLMSLYKALTPRKGDAASVRRQSRQRLRSERRYRRNRLVRFIVTLYGLQVPARDSHVASLLGMTNLGAGAVDGNAFKFVTALGAQGAPLQTQSAHTISR